MIEEFLVKFFTLYILCYVLLFALVFRMLQEPYRRRLFYPFWILYIVVLSLMAVVFLGQAEIPLTLTDYVVVVTIMIRASCI
jgi:amino acid transporter